MRASVGEPFLAARVLRGRRVAEECACVWVFLVICDKGGSESYPAVKNSKIPQTLDRGHPAA